MAGAQEHELYHIPDPAGIRADANASSKKSPGGVERDLPLHETLERTMIAP